MPMQLNSAIFPVECKEKVQHTSWFIAGGNKINAAYFNKVHVFVTSQITQLLVITLQHLTLFFPQKSNIRQLTLQSQKNTHVFAEALVNHIF